jgi:hypothetical protein
MAHEDASSPASRFQSVFVLGQRDELFDEPLKLLGATERCPHISGSDELPLQVGKQGVALVGREPELSSIYLVSHFSL